MHKDRLQRRITRVVATNCIVEAATTQPKCGHKTENVGTVPKTGASYARRVSDGSVSTF